MTGEYTGETRPGGRGYVSSKGQSSRSRKKRRASGQSAKVATTTAPRMDSCISKRRVASAADAGVAGEGAAGAAAARRACSCGEMGRLVWRTAQ